MQSTGKKTIELNGDFQEKNIWTHHVSKRKLANAPKLIPRAKSGTISSHNESSVPKQSSAPVKISDWSKIYNKKSSSRSVDEGDDGMVPPHEYIARRAARRQVASSMCEGVGRTLKGRDLSNVRNAILTKTGFLESNHQHHYSNF